jgi:hypothetical protein
MPHDGDRRGAGLELLLPLWSGDALYPPRPANNGGSIKVPEPGLGDALYPPLPARRGGESGVPLRGDALRPAGDAAPAGDWVLGVALYPPRPMGDGCPTDAGDPLRGVAL